MQNTSFMSFVSKLVSVRVKQEMNAIVKNLYFKLPANNITPSTLKEFCLKKIKNNITADVIFFYSLIEKASGVKKVNAGNGDKNTFITTRLAAKSIEERHFRHIQRENQGRSIYC